jgi:hypothetical protein
MSSLPKRERLCTKLVELFTIRVVERRSTIMSSYGGEFVLRVLGELISAGVEFSDFELFFGSFP